MRWVFFLAAAAAAAASKAIDVPSSFLLPLFALLCEQEADIDEDEEQNLVADWNTADANEAYREHVELAQREEKEREEAAAAWLAQYGLVPQSLDVSLPNSGFLRAGGRGGRGVIEAYPGTAAADAFEAADYGAADDIDTAVSPRPNSGLPAAKRQRFGWTSATVVVRPWEPSEDFVLCSVVAMLLERGEILGPLLWSTASDVLGGGAAATTLTGVEAAARQGRRRTPEACKARHVQLTAALRTSRGSPEAACGAADGLLKELCCLLATGADGQPAVADAVLASVHSVLVEAAEASPALPSGVAAAEITRRFYALRAAARGLLGAVVQEESVAEELPCAAGEATAVAAAVKLRCGPGAARVIGGRLTSIVGELRGGTAAFFAGLPSPVAAAQALPYSF
jgi:hypothetical protein